jgi:hypothetical protein
MALANTNISVTLVKTELSSSDTSVNDLCQDSSINKWSRFKPVKFKESWGIGSCGLEVTVGSFNGTTLSNQWDYVARVGGVSPANTGFRLGQFKKYKHLAVDPMGTTNYQSSSTSDFAYFYPPADFDDVDSFEVSIAGVIAQLSSSWTGAWYFGVRMRSNNSTYIYAVAPENLNPASTPILSSGVSFNFSNSRFNSLPSTGTYEYQAFITDTYDTAFSSSNLRLQSELTTTQQAYKMLTLPLSTGTFTRTAPAPTITSFSGTIGANDASIACALATNTTYYHNGAGTYPTTGDSVYTNSAGTIGLSQAKYSRGVGYFQIQAGGTIVDAVGIC